MIIILLIQYFHKRPLSRRLNKRISKSQLGRKRPPDVPLNPNGSPIPVVEESKFLGILFDRKLSFIPHIKYLKAKCLKALNLLKVLSHTSWGADPTTFLKLYRSLVWSKLEIWLYYIWLCTKIISSNA